MKTKIIRLGLALFMAATITFGTLQASQSLVPVCYSYCQPCWTVGGLCQCQIGLRWYTMTCTDWCTYGCVPY